MRQAAGSGLALKCRRRGRAGFVAGRVPGHEPAFTDQIDFLCKPRLTETNFQIVADPRPNGSFPPVDPPRAGDRTLHWDSMPTVTNLSRWLSPCFL